MAEFIECCAFCGKYRYEYDFLSLSTCLFLVTRVLTFLPPGYKVNQDGGLFTRSFLWFTSGLLGVPLPQIASGYPKLVSGTIFTKVLCWCEDKLCNLLTYWNFLGVAWSIWIILFNLICCLKTYLSYKWNKISVQ